MNKYETPAAVGGSSLLVIFAVLCLVVFALLGCATVQADGRLSAVSAQAVADYYRADAQAEEILAQLRGGDIPEGVIREGNRYRYQCPVSEKQILQVIVDISGESYTIRQWSVCSTANWEEENNTSVWDGALN